ncbi:MAG: hypothetical protein MHM6MM_006013, partial [Cercozoa sp. M6MM]
MGKKRKEKKARECARVELQESCLPKSLKQWHVQQLVLWPFELSTSPRFATVHNRTSLRRVVFLLIDGLSQHVFLQMRDKDMCPNLCDIFTHAIPTSNGSSRMDGRNATRQLLALQQRDEFVPFKIMRKRRMKEKAKNEEPPIPAIVSESEASNSTGAVSSVDDSKAETVAPVVAEPLAKKRKLRDGSPLPVDEKSDSEFKLKWEQILVSDEERATHEYPTCLPEDESQAQAWLTDAQLDELAVASPSVQRVVGLDCEMVQTAEAYELARITLVSDQGEVLLDELVKPSNAVVKYHTRYSGITEAMLADVSTTLRDVQRRLLPRFCNSRTVLVGHGLENDLTALKWLHTRNVDTALLFPHRHPNLKNSLRFLTN